MSSASMTTVPLPPLKRTRWSGTGLPSSWRTERRRGERTCSTSKSRGKKAVRKEWRGVVLDRFGTRRGAHSPVQPRARTAVVSFMVRLVPIVAVSVRVHVSIQVSLSLCACACLCVHVYAGTKARMDSDEEGWGVLGLQCARAQGHRGLRSKHHMACSAGSTKRLPPRLLCCKPRRLPPSSTHLPRPSIHRQNQGHTNSARGG